MVRKAEKGGPMFAGLLVQVVISESSESTYIRYEMERNGGKTWHWPLVSTQTSTQVCIQMNTYTCISDESCSFDICPDKHELGTQRRGNSLPNISINSWDSIRLHNILLPLPQWMWASNSLKSDCVKIQQRLTHPQDVSVCFHEQRQAYGITDRAEGGLLSLISSELEEAPSEVPVGTQAHRLIMVRSLLLNLWLENIQSKSLPRRSWRWPPIPGSSFLH